LQPNIEPQNSLL